MTKQLEITPEFKNDLEKSIIYLEKKNYKIIDRIKSYKDDEWNWESIINSLEEDLEMNICMINSLKSTISRAKVI